MFLSLEIDFVGLVLKERCMILPILSRLSSHQRGFLHVDLFGAVHEDSLGGKKYCLVIVDD